MLRVLIVNPFGIGDVLFSLPLVRAIRQEVPAAFIGYLCNARTEELVSGWPEVDWRFTFEKDEFRRLWSVSRWQGIHFLRRTLEAVRAERFDTLVDLSLGWHTGLAGMFCGIRRRIGFDFKERGKFLTDALSLSGYSSRPVAEIDLDLLELMGLPRPAGIDFRLSLPVEAEKRAEEYLSRQQLAGGSFAAVVPAGGASWGPNARYKQWPPERFAEVADHLTRRHRLDVLLIGDRTEEPLCREVAGRMSASAPRIVQIPSLLTLAGILKRSKLVLGNDGGTMHLAAAAGARTVSIFGPVDATVYGPLGGGSEHRVVAKNLACRPCYRQFRFPACPWDNACLKNLEAEPVLRAADEILKD